MKEELKEWIRGKSSKYSKIVLKIDSKKKMDLTPEEEEFLRVEFDSFLTYKLSLED